MPSPHQAATDAAVRALSPLRRLKPQASLGDGIAELSEGNPGALAVMLGVFTAHLPAGMVFLLDLDQADLAGAQIYLLAQLAGSPLRAAALVHSCVQRSLPTLEELRRELRACERDPAHGLPPRLEAVIKGIGEHAPQFRGADLTRPQA